MKEKPKYCPQAAEAGFTLMEVMVAVCVLAIASAVFFVAYWNNVRINTSTQHDEICLTAARSQLENIRAAGFSAVMAKYNTYNGMGFAVEGLDAASDDADGLPGRVALSTLASDLVMATIIIRYRGASGDEEYELSGYISPY